MTTEKPLTTTRLESDKVRLIDANALKEIIGCGALYFIDEVFKIIDSAPTVETTDEANKFFVGFMQSLNPGEQLLCAGTAGRFIEYVQKKKLEASLNQK